MDKKILIEYADMKEEIKDLRRRIAEDKKKIEQLNKITVQDSVACGKKGNKPLRTVKITGFPQREYEKRIKDLSARGEEREEERKNMEKILKEYEIQIQKLKELRAADVGDGSSGETDTGRGIYREDRKESFKNYVQIILHR